MQSRFTGFLVAVLIMGLISCSNNGGSRSSKGTNQSQPGQQNPASAPSPVTNNRTTVSETESATNLNWAFSYEGFAPLVPNSTLTFNQSFQVTDATMSLTIQFKNTSNCIGASVQNAQGQSFSHSFTNADWQQEESCETAPCTFTFGRGGLPWDTANPPAWLNYTPPPILSQGAWNLTFGGCDGSGQAGGTIFSYTLTLYGT